MKIKKKITVLKLSDSQFWLVTWALIQMTSDHGEAALRKEFPDLDIEALAKDMDPILKQLVAARKSMGH